MKRIPLLLAGICLPGALLVVPRCAAAPPSEPVKIGALFSVTGPASFLGAPEEKTAQMLVEKINASGGVSGRKLVLVVKDCLVSEAPAN
jgi:branched-chain amino acid transport system substrate-binding protein